MALGLQTLRKGLVSGLNDNTQLNDQSAAVTAVAYTASGAINDADSVVTIATNVQAYTIAQPRIGRILVISEVGAAAGGITVTLTSGTYDGTNSIATFNAAAETLVLLGISNTRFLILKNIGSVALS